MDDTKPIAVRRSTYPRRPSRIKIAAIWLALLIGSFLFGMLIISPLLGIVMSGGDKDKPAPKKSTPAKRSEANPNLPQVSAPVNAVREPRRQPEPGISLSPDESNSQIHASDQFEAPKSEPPALQNPTEPLPSPATPPIANPPSDPKQNPIPAPETQEAVQRPEKID